MRFSCFLEQTLFMQVIEYHVSAEKTFPLSDLGITEYTLEVLCVTDCPR